MARIYIAFVIAILIVPAQAAPPELQGIWGRISFPGFGRPLTGAGPVITRGRLTANAYVGDYINPILKQQAAEIAKRRGEIGLDGTHALNPRAECWPTGVPLILTSIAMEIIHSLTKS